MTETPRVSSQVAAVVQGSTRELQIAAMGPFRSVLGQWLALYACAFLSFLHDLLYSFFHSFVFLKKKKENFFFKKKDKRAGWENFGVLN